jgi:uncharacterized membrane protein
MLIRAIVLNDLGANKSLRRSARWLEKKTVGENQNRSPATGMGEGKWEKEDNGA